MDMRVEMSAPIWQAGRFRLDLARPLVMGIVNLTPDSFSDGDPELTPARAIAICERLLAEGADVLDLGGESSRPGAEPVSVEEELGRVLPVLRAAVSLGCAISVDTNKPDVMQAALDLGADIVNDISALRASGAMDVVAAHPTCGVCLMHMRGTPQTMSRDARYEGDDVVAEVAAFLRDRVAEARAAGIGAERIVVDAGIGFGKTPAHNLALLARQGDLLAMLGRMGISRPLLAGWSRKSTLAALVGAAGTPARERSAAQRHAVEVASVAAAVLSVERGARIVRVHDVAATVAALAVVRAAMPTADNRVPP